MSDKDMAGEIYRLADLLMFALRIKETHSCNNCGIQKSCQYCPRPGETVRYNCPLWGSGTADNKALETLDDLIRRKDAIDAIYDDGPPEPHYPDWYVTKIKKLRAARQKGESK